MAGWDKQMKSMELDDEEKLDAHMPIAMENKPDYPFGLRICLTTSELKKLGLDAADCSRGDRLKLYADCRVTEVSHVDSEHGGKQSRVELQIEKLDTEDSE